MPHDRYFIDDSLKKGSRIYLEREAIHKLRNVMRKREGEKVELINGKGYLAIGMVEELSAHKGVLSVSSCRETPLAPPSLIAAEPLLKMAALELVIQKGTELGIEQFWLFPGDRSEKDTLSSHQLQRLQMIAISAMEQCGRLDLPEILLQPPLEKISLSNGLFFFSDLRTTALPFLEIAKKIPTYSTKIFLLSGPEKGWSDRELAYLDEQKNGSGFNLHKENILRAETAAIATYALFTQFLPNTLIIEHPKLSLT